MSDANTNNTAVNLLARLLSKNPVLKLECDQQLAQLPEPQRAELYENIFRSPTDQPISLDSITATEGRSLPVVYSAADALVPQPPLEWVVANLIPACSVGMLVGAPGSKKTFSLLDLAVRAAAGQDWLGFKTRASSILIFDEESGPHRIKRRLSGAIRAHDGNGSLPIHFTSLAHFDLRNPVDLDNISHLIRTYQAKMVILDALADFMLGADENSVQFVQPVFQSLRQIAEENQCAIIVVHHLNKMGGYRGSSAILGAVDFLIKQISENGSSLITFETEKLRDGEPVTFYSQIHFGEEELVWLSRQEGRLASEKENEKALNCAQSILALLKLEGDLQEEEVVSGLSARFQESTVTSNLYKMRRDGRLKTIKQPLSDGGAGELVVVGIP